MQNQQIDSAFKMPMAPPPPPSQAETLLFNDILEEKVIALRNNMMEFLQVLPYRKFDIEFSNFLKRTKGMILEGQRAGANVSRLTNSSLASYPRPSASFHYRPSTSQAMSMMSSHRNSTFRAPENSFQPVESLNPFKPPGVQLLQPRVVLPRIEQFSRMSDRSQLLATVIEVSHKDNLNRNSNNDHEHFEVPERLERSKSPTPPNRYSDVTINEDDFISNSQQNDNLNSGSNSVESLLEGAGFKIVLGVPEGNKTTRNNENQHGSQSQIVKNVEKFLSKWSVNAKVIKSSNLKSKVIVLLTGTLLEDNRTAIVEQRHDAGVLESRKDLDLIKTSNGLYRLVGNIIGGSPNELYLTCKESKGIPRIWKKLVNEWCGVEKVSKNIALNFSLDSPAGPIKSVKPKTVANLNMSITRNGKPYSVNQSSRMSNGKRKSSDHNEFESKSKQRKFHVQTPPLIASTPKRPVKPCLYESPSQLLKKKMQNKATARLTGQNSNVLNDSICVTKRRQSLSKEQKSNEFSKPKSPVMSLLKTSNDKRCNQVSTITSTGSKNSSKQSKRKVENVSNVLSSVNNGTSHSSRKMSESDTYSTATLKNSNKFMNKLSATTSKNGSNSSRKLTQITPSIHTSTKNAKQIEQKENVDNDISLVKNKPVIKKNKKAEKKVQSQANAKAPVAVEKKSNECTVKKKQIPQSSLSVGPGLFDHIDVGSDSDVDFNMQSSGKLSVLSRGEKSRSGTPPFGPLWSAKSLTISNPPTPLSKSIEAKALKRVKAPKITLEEELRNQKRFNKIKASSYDEVHKKINKFLQFGEEYDE